MQSDTVLIFYYNYENRYGFNTLTGALDTDCYFDNLKIIFIKNKSDLLTKLKELSGSVSKIVIGFSFFTTQIWEINDIIKEVKSYSYNTILIAGGPHSSGDPEGTLKIGFDIAVSGEGEKTLIDLLKKIDIDEDYFNIEGISFYKDGKYVKNKRKSFLDLDSYPPFSIKYEKAGSFELSRGCANVCHYCQTPRIFSTHVRYRSIDKVCEYLIKLKTIDYKDARFIITDAFNYRPDGKKDNQLEDFLKRLKEAIAPDGRIFLGSFPSEVRPESVNEENLNMILKYCSNDNLIIGAQSGSQRILDLCRRNHTVKEIITSAELSVKSGLKVNADFIFGLPGETDDDREETVKIIDILTNMGVKIHAHTFIPLPATPYWNKEAGKLYQKTAAGLNKLIHKGFVYGNWIKQADIGEKIYKYLNEGKI